MLSLTNVKLTPGNDTVEIQQKISEHPKKCLHAILEDVAKQYTMATPAYDMSVSAMKNHYSENLQAHQEALYEAALEQGLTHDDMPWVRISLQRWKTGSRCSRRRSITMT